MLPFIFSSQMKQSDRKLARGQMVYAPISSTAQNRSRSPFSQSKKILITSKSQQDTFVQPVMRQQSHPRPHQQSPQSPYAAYQPSPFSKPSNSISPYHQFQQQLSQLVKQNSELKAREQIYISKLLKLQQGLQKQHEEFMNLQQLYNELFNVYKQKEEEISQLELRYKETERSRVEFNSYNKRDQQNMSVMSIDKMNSIRQNVLEDNFKNELAQLIFQNKRLNETNEKVIAQLNYLKSKEKLNDSRQTLQQKVFDELNDWQKQVDSEKQERIKLDYQNKFLKIRNEDLEKTITELQKIISMKQNEIIKMREEKFSTRRQSSEKVLNKSPPKPNQDSARSKGSSQDNKKFVKLIENLQKENNRLRQQNLSLKEKVKGNMFQKQTARLSDSIYSGGPPNYVNFQKRLEFQDLENKINSNPQRGYQNQNFNSQNLNEQYFSFSRQKQERQSEEDLPSFPLDLEIEGIIRKHQDHKKEPNVSGKQTEVIGGSQ